MYVLLIGEEVATVVVRETGRVREVRRRILCLQRGDWAVGVNVKRGKRHGSK